MLVTQPSSEWMLAIPFAVLGLAALTSGAVMLKRRIMALIRGEMFDAVVASRDSYRLPAAVKRAPDNVGRSSATPHFLYRTAEGEERTARLDHQTPQRLRSEGYKLRYPIGTQARIRVNPREPDIAFDRSIWGTIVFSSLLTVAGTLMCLLALGIYFGS